MAEPWPRDVRLYVWLYLLSSLIGIVGVTIIWIPLNGLVGSVEASAIGSLIGLAILGPFFWFALWKQRNCARWVLLVAFLASLPFCFFDFQGKPPPLPTVALLFVATLVNAAGIYFLFSRDSDAWFQARKTN